MARAEEVIGRAVLELERDRQRRLASGTGAAIVAGRSHPALASSLAALLGRAVEACTIEHFPDGEIQVAIDERVRGRDVYLVQSTIPPVGENILELALVADAAHRRGAARVNAVIPYFGFARQERRTHDGEPLGARVVADLISCGRFSRLVAVDLHSPAIEGFFAVPLERVSAASVLARAARAHVTEDTVIVSPDLGGAKLAREYARMLERPLAIVHKTRLSGRVVEVHDVVGEVKDRSCLIVDDLVSTGGTIAAAIAALRERGARARFVVVATHALLAGDADDVLSRAGVDRLVATDTVPPRDGGTFARTTVSVAPLLAEAVAKLSRG